ncbi:MAG: flagellar biosynthesis anti-sigma factor FlgM [Bacteriovoracia bacterium]
MKVTNNHAANVQSSEANRAKGAAEAAKAKSASSAEKLTSSKIDSGSAQTEISSRAKEMALAKEVASNAADVREDKIAELKRRIANKEYNVKPEAIADRMVDEHLKTAELG